MPTTVLAYVIAAGLLMLIFGSWGLFVLNTAEVDVALTDEAIAFGLIGGGLAMIGVAQAPGLYRLSITHNFCPHMRAQLDVSQTR
jgi:hypothetical protein